MPNQVEQKAIAGATERMVTAVPIATAIVAAPPATFAISFQGSLRRRFATASLMLASFLAKVGPSSGSGLRVRFNCKNDP